LALGEADYKITHLFLPSLPLSLPPSFFQEFLGVNEGRMGVALGGALDDHKEAVEGSVRLAQEAAAVVAAREGGREGGHEHEEHAHKGEEAAAAAATTHSHDHKHEEKEHKHDHSHDDHKHEEKDNKHEKKEEETKAHSHDDHEHQHEHKHEHEEEREHKHDHDHSSHSHDHDHYHDDHDHDHDHSTSGKTASQTTAETRFRIGTFIYLQRKPFHPDRFADFLEELAASSYAAVQNVMGAKKKTEGGKGFGTSSSPSSSSSSSPLVTSVLSGLLRSKGFIWLACTDQAALYFSHAGRSLSVSCMGRWWASVPRESWPVEREKDIWEDFEGGEEGGGEGEGGFGDRRNEVVFIGVGLFEEEKQRVLKERLDACLLTGEEEEGREGGWGGEMGLYVEKAKEGSALALFDAFPNRIEIDMAGGAGQG